MTKKGKKKEAGTKIHYRWVRCTDCGGTGFRMTDWNKADVCPYCTRGYVKRFTG